MAFVTTTWELLCPVHCRRTRMLTRMTQRTRRTRILTRRTRILTQTRESQRPEKSGKKMAVGQYCPRPLLLDLKYKPLIVERLLLIMMVIGVNP